MTAPIDNVHPLMRPGMSELPDTVAAHRGEVGIPDIPSEAEEPQVHPEDDGFDPA